MCHFVPPNYLRCLARDKYIFSSDQKRQKDQSVPQFKLRLFLRWHSELRQLFESEVGARAQRLAGPVQLRERVRVPVLQVLEQLLHALHAVQTDDPSKKWEKIVHYRSVPTLSG